MLVKTFNLLFWAKYGRDFKRDIVPTPFLEVLSLPTLTHPHKLLPQKNFVFSGAPHALLKLSSSPPIEVVEEGSTG